METHNSPGPPANVRNPLKGIGKKLKLHVIIPVIYAVILITVFVITHV